MDTARWTPTWRFSEPINTFDSESDLKTSSRLVTSEATTSKSTRVHERFENGCDSRYSEFCQPLLGFSDPTPSDIMYATHKASFQSERGPISPRNPFATPHQSRSPTSLHRSHTSTQEALELSDSSQLSSWFPGSLIMRERIQIGPNILLGLAPPRRRKHKSARLTEDEKNKCVLDSTTLNETNEF
jgi:hypothetical protein